MAILNDKYTLNSTLNFNSLLDDIEEYNLEKSFTVGGIKFTKLSIKKVKGEKFNHIELRYISSTKNIEVYTAIEKNGQLSNATWFEVGGLTIEQLKELTFNNITVADDFYLWFINNVIPTTEIISAKLTRLKELIESATKETYSTLTEAVTEIVKKYNN